MEDNFWPDDVLITTAASRRAERFPVPRNMAFKRTPEGFAIHSHFATDTPKGNDMIGDTPEALEAAATHALSRAAELRAVDAMEPTDDEATISWTWTPDYPEAKTYTFVGFRGDNAKWYVTGKTICRDGVTWRELAFGKFGKSLRDGRFYVVSEWAWQGPDDDDE